MSARHREPLSVYAFVGALWLAAAGLFLLTRQYHGLDMRPVDVAVFMVLAVLSENWCVPISSSSTMSLSFTVHLATGVMFGPGAAALVAAVGILVTDAVIHRSPRLRVAFNVAQMATAAMVAATVYSLLGGSSPIDLVNDALPLCLAGLAYLFVNNTLVCVVLSLTGRRFTQEWLESVRDVLLPYAAMAPLGALAAYAYESTPWSVLYFIPLVLVIYNGFKLFVTLQHETDHALVALADSIDKRDQYTYQHSMRVARLSGEIAEAMGLSPRDVDLLVAAARVHDLGKIATDNRVLFKQSSLSDDERLRRQAHPAEGGELAGRFSMFREGRRFIRHHHERWDGKGYPDGLAGEDIPLGARIIAVADSYDAMTSDRPYRKALPHDVALIELQRGAGSQFDPAVVDAFLARERSRRAEPARVTAEAGEACSF